MMVGKQRMPESRSYFYQDLMLPVLLDSLRGGWQANELARPLARLKAMDNNGLLRRTLQAWFRHNAAAGDVKGAVYSSQYAGVPVEPYLGADRPGSR
ncbi:hypothetical protein M3O75_01310 [Klebsiella pneumoniae]|nr:hypothetical protein [Klebsiella pneumoniae]